MRRFFAAALIAAFGSHAAADYLILRVVLDGGPAAATDPAAPAATPPAADGGAATGTDAPPPPAGDPSRSVVVVVPIRKREREPFDPTKGSNRLTNPTWEYVLHPYGKTYLFTDERGSVIQLYDQPGRTNEVASRLRHEAWKKDANPNELYDIAAKALAAGMNAEAEAYCDELLKLAPAKKDALTPDVKRFVEAYAALSPKLKGPATQPTEAGDWRDRFSIGAAAGSEAKVQASNHYALIFWDADSTDVARRLAQLEGQFKAFYLWHALRGIPMKVPDRPLVAVLPNQTKNAWIVARALEARAGGTDAFYSPEHGVLVLSPGRIDEVGQSFQRYMQAVYKGTSNPADLLRGKGPSIGKDMPADEVARKMTMALIDRAHQDDCETAAVGREGARQILGEIGVLPRHVAVPRWLESGIGSLFERPYGAVYTDKETARPKMTLSLSRGLGSPHFAMLKWFHDLAAARELNPKEEDLLANVLSNAYFDAARTGDDADPAPKKPAATDGRPTDPERARARKLEVLNAKAKATAWALVHYLVQSKPAEFYRFCGELDRLPRDLPLDDRTLRLAFARAFGLLSADGSATDGEKFAAFAADWLKAMGDVKSNAIERELEKPPAPKGPAP